jgi:hypothetical protein
MAIKTGRYGQVSWDPAGGTALVPIVSINSFTADFKTEYEDVSCFGDSNRVYIPGLMDVGGDFEGFFNAAELALFAAAMQPTPGMLKLQHNVNEPAIAWQGLAYMSASIDCSLDAPKVSAEWKAGGPWTVPGMVKATSAGPGTGVGSFAPTGATPPLNFADLSDASPITATPATAWTTGQYIQLADGSKAHWNGTAWVVGAKP